MLFTGSPMFQTPVFLSAAAALEDRTRPCIIITPGFYRSYRPPDHPENTLAIWPGWRWRFVDLRFLPLFDATNRKIVVT
jgi:hypothetical protein